MWKNDCRPSIFITIGEVAGIGPEVIAKTLKDEQIRRSARIYVIGTDTVFYDFLDKNFINIVTDIRYYYPTHMNIIKVDNLKGFKFGQPDKDTARFAIRSLEVAALMAKKVKNAAIVTAPIYKKGMQDAGFSFPGHTEFLSERFNSKVLMSFWGKKLKVATLTTHLPLKDVSKNIKKQEIFDALNISFNSLKRFLNKSNPEIAVLGLNPHAGEEGSLGKEELEIIKPVCDEFREKGYKLTGPIPADSAFHAALKGDFDMIIGMYHDQVLAPFKMLYFDEGVNVTLGLPFVRTSPDHGTAFDIAGKGIASEKSFKNALKLAIKMTRNWRNNENKVRD